MKTTWGPSYTFSTTPPLPASSSGSTQVRVRISPSLVGHDARLEMGNGAAELTLNGNFDASGEQMLKSELGKVTAAAPKKFVIDVTGLKGLSKPAGRALVFAREKLPLETDVYVVGANDSVKKQLKDSGFLDQVKSVADASEIK